MKHQIQQEKLCREIARRFSITLEDAKAILAMNHKSAKKINNNGYQEDLGNIGWIEIIKTLDTVDLTNSAKPSTCCYWPIKKAMVRAMQQEHSYKERKEELSENLTNNAESQQEIVIKQQQMEFLARCLRTLPKHTREVLKFRFGLENSERLTLQEIGKKFKLSKQRIKQIETIGINSLREYFKEQGF